MERITERILWISAIVAIFTVVRTDTSSERGSAQDTVRVTVYDTIAYHQPAPKDEKPLGSITAKLPVSVPEVERLDTQVRKDSVDVEIPITRTMYEDSTYTAYVSGYRASLDSLIFRMPRETMTITKYPKPKRWSVGIQAGYGMTLKGTPQFAPYIGIGVSYNLFIF